MKKLLSLILVVFIVFTGGISAFACDGVLFGPRLVCTHGAIRGETGSHVKGGATCTMTEYLSYATEYCTWCTMTGCTRVGPYLCFIEHNACGVGRDYWCTRNHWL